MEGFNHLKKLHMLDFAGNRITVVRRFDLLLHCNCAPLCF